MKPRRVTVLLEVETARPLSMLRRTDFWSICALGPGGKILQVQANVIRPKKAEKKRKRARR